MHRLWKLSLIFLVIFSKCSANEVNFAHSSTQFAADLYKNAKNGNTNIVFSPLSIQTALGLAYMGAGGKTAQEFEVGLHLGTNDRSVIASNFEQLMNRYNDGRILKIANKIYTKNEYELKPDFIEVAQKKFNSEVESINFSDNVYAANTINEWVENRTNNKIKDLFTSGQFSSDTKMTLVNAVYFKGSWAHPFDKRRTHKGPFWISGSESVQVDMMHIYARFRCRQFEDLSASAVLLPYKDSDLGMLIIVPNDRTGLTELENKLQTYDLLNITNSLFSMRAYVLMPKFKIETTFSLKSTLEQLGMSTMFTENADFSNIFKNAGNVKVSDAIHKAYIDVDEEGTEAAAATGIKIVAMSMPRRIVADRPFFFAIVSQNDVSFVGSVRKF